MFPKTGGKTQNGWFIMENPMNKWMIWGYHYFWKHPYTRTGNTNTSQAGKWGPRIESMYFLLKKKDIPASYASFTRGYF